MSRQAKTKNGIEEKVKAKKGKRETKSVEKEKNEEPAEIGPSPIPTQTTSKSPKEFERIESNKNELESLEEESIPTLEPLQISQIRIKEPKKKGKIKEKGKNLLESELPPVKLKVFRKYKLKRSSGTQLEIKKSEKLESEEEAKPSSSEKYEIYPKKQDKVAFKGQESEKPMTPQSDILIEPRERKRIDLEIPDFMKELLGKSAARTISKKGPSCIIVPKDRRKRLDQLLATICRDTYREKEGGKPTPLFRRDMEELRTELEPEWEEEIVVVEEADSSERLFQTLKEYFSLDTGFLILVSENPIALEDKILREIPTSDLPLSRVEEVDISRDMEIEIIKMVRGRVPTRSSRIFGSAVMESVNEFENELIDRFLSYERLPSPLIDRYDDLTSKSPNSDGIASELHSAIKGFIWIYEWKKHEKKTIPRLETGEEVADVEIESKKYEVETLFGVGDPLSKLTRKIGKYEKHKYQIRSDTEVRFVMRNFDILRHLRELLIFRNEWRKKGMNMEIFGLNLQDLKLISIDKFKKFVTKFGEI